MDKMLIFDMDGTLANFYGVEGWLQDLENSNPRPYIEAEPMYDMVKMAEILNALKVLGYTIIVTTWLAKNSSKEYKKEVRQAKRDWLNRHNFPYDELHMVQYGTTKADCTRHKQGYQILFDDNAKIRAGWHLGTTIDANNDIMPILELLKWVSDR